MRINDWSSDVCSSDLLERGVGCPHDAGNLHRNCFVADVRERIGRARILAEEQRAALCREIIGLEPILAHQHRIERFSADVRSEEHTSELQSLMRISYAVLCLKKKK